MQPCEELCISRAIDRTATAEDWRALESVATADPDVWRRLCLTLQEETLLGRQVAALLPEPAPRHDPSPECVVVASSTRTGAAKRVGIRSWLAAALLMLAFWCGHATAVPAEPAGVPAAAGDGGDADPDELLSAYLDAGQRSGRVLEQLPPRPLATRRLPDEQGVEIVFVRSFVERAHIDSAVTLASDEHGRPTPLVVDLAHYLPPTDY